MARDKSGEILSLSSVPEGLDATDGRCGGGADMTDGIIGGSGRFAGETVVGVSSSTWLMVSSSSAWLLA